MLLETEMDTPISRSLLGSSEATTYELVRLPSNGVVTLHDPATGSFTYEPKSGFSGGDSFSFIVLKGEIRSSEGVVQIAIKAGESDPGDPEPEPAPTSTAECKALWTPILGGQWNVNKPAPSGYERRNWTYTLTQGASDQWQLVEAYEEKSTFWEDAEFKSYEYERTGSIQYAKVNDLPYACWFGLHFMLAGHNGGTINVQSAGGTASTLTR